MNMNKMISYFLVFFLSFCFITFSVDARVHFSHIYNNKDKRLFYSYRDDEGMINLIKMTCNNSNSGVVDAFTLFQGSQKSGSGYLSLNHFPSDTYSCSVDISGDINNYHTDIFFEVVTSSTTTTTTTSQTNVENVAQNPCDENDIRKALKIIGYILLVIRVAVPLIIIGFATYDLFKSVIDKDEKSFNKQMKQIIIRMVAGLLVFFVPSFVYAIFSISDRLNIIDEDQYKTCAECVLKPGDDNRCQVN